MEEDAESILQELIFVRGCWEELRYLGKKSING